MARPEDFTYYQARAQRERAIGSMCEDNGVALVHFRIADEYDRRLAAMAEPWSDNRIRARA